MARGLWCKSVPVPQLLLVLPFKRARDPAPGPVCPGSWLASVGTGGPGGGAPVQGALPATPLARSCAGGKGAEVRGAEEQLETALRTFG